jgi:16S rRNA (uracil1498-N3)-methyltransferase
VITVLVPPGTRAAGERLAVDEEEAHHLRVRRAEDGDRVRFVDGAGAGGIARLERAGKDPALVIETTECHARPPALVLAVGAGDRERFTWLVEKAAELGVTQVLPIETERTASVATRVRDVHVEKLARRAREAIKQSGAFWAPVVEAPQQLAQFLARAIGTRLLLDADGASCGALAADEPVTALVGPEGGLTAGERAHVLSNGFRPVRVGPHILRFETAAIAAATLIQAAREGRRDG